MSWASILQTDFTIKGLVSTMPTNLQMDQVIVGRYIQGDIGSTIDIHGHNLTIVRTLGSHWILA